MSGCKHFKIPEVFHSDYFTHPHPWSIRPQVIWDRLDALREAWGKPILINVGGIKNAGVRVVGSRVGATKSAHQPIYEDRQAFDLHGRSLKETYDLYEWVYDKGYKIGWVWRMENRRYTPGWCHVEIRTTEPTECVEFNP